jgi:hypothetical protein
VFSKFLTFLFKKNKDFANAAELLLRHEAGTADGDGDPDGLIEGVGAGVTYLSAVDFENGRKFGAEELYHGNFSVFLRLLT